MARTVAACLVYTVAEGGRKADVHSLISRLEPILRSNVPAAASVLSWLTANPVEFRRLMYADLSVSEVQRTVVRQLLVVCAATVWVGEEVTLSGESGRAGRAGL